MSGEIVVVAFVLLWACWLLWNGRANGPSNRRTRAVVEEWRRESGG